MSRIVIVGLTALPPSMSRLSGQCGILNISQPYRPPRPVMGIALLFFLLIIKEVSAMKFEAQGMPSRLFV
jgi:hypothetical protein